MQIPKLTSALVLPISVLGLVTGLSMRPANAQSWSTTGNAGTAPPTNFVGTTDVQPFEIHVDNADPAFGGGVMRFEPSTCDSLPDGTDCGFNLIGGKLGLNGNSVTSGAVGVTVFGGGQNFDFGFTPNIAGGDFATISGGGGNTALGGADVIGGGLFNTTNSGVIDPALNNASATVGGGFGNSATASWATVPGGNSNTASGAASFAAGSFSAASGVASFAAGNQAIAAHDGAFVWSDDHQSPFKSIGKNSFNVRASGGTRIISGLVGNVPTGVSLAPGGGSWSSLSDRNAKANLKPVDGKEIVKQLAAIPVATWNYKAQTSSIRHIGPMAQDFSAAFKVGEDDKHITTIDSEGVALAAIQGLYAMVKEKDWQLASMQARLNSLELEVAAQQNPNVRGTAARASSCSSGILKVSDSENRL
jgi:hypothetical protein